MQTFQTSESLESMKLSEKTFNLLKNFSSINQSILFKEGNSLRTMSVMKNILAEVEIEEDFPKDFAIYDLVQFLNLKVHNITNIINVKYISYLVSVTTETYIRKLFS